MWTPGAEPNFLSLRFPAGQDEVEDAAHCKGFEEDEAGEHMWQTRLWRAVVGSLGLSASCALGKLPCFHELVLVPLSSVYAQSRPGSLANAASVSSPPA